MSTRYKLSIEIRSHLPKSLNVALRSNRWKQQRQNKLWDLMIGAKCAGKLPPQPLAKAHLKIVRHAYRMLDFDGLVGSLKPVVDALVTAGVLLDDRWSVTGTWEIDQRFRPKVEGTLLEIEVCSVDL